MYVKIKVGRFLRHCMNVKIMNKIADDITLTMVLILVDVCDFGLL